MKEDTVQLSTMLLYDYGKLVKLDHNNSDFYDALEWVHEYVRKFLTGGKYIYHESDLFIQELDEVVELKYRDRSNTKNVFKHKVTLEDISNATQDSSAPEYLKRLRVFILVLNKYFSLCNSVCIRAIDNRIVEVHTY